MEVEAEEDMEEEEGEDMVDVEGDAREDGPNLNVFLQAQSSHTPNN